MILLFSLFLSVCLTVVLSLYPSDCLQLWVGLGGRGKQGDKGVRLCLESMVLSLPLYE